MNELEQLWRERLDWVQASGKACHADCGGDDRKDDPARPSEHSTPVGPPCELICQTAS
jgi:hypothetical protein